MLIRYARVSKADGAQVLELQVDASKKEGVTEDHTYSDKLSGKKDARPGLDACLKALRENDTLVVWKLDRLGRSLHHLVKTVKHLSKKYWSKSTLRSWCQIDTTSPTGKLVFGIFASLAEFEGDLILERTMAGLSAARARGRKGGRKFELTKAQVRLAQAAMSSRDSRVSELCRELGITRTTLYRYISPTGQLREAGNKVLNLV